MSVLDDQTHKKSYTKGLVWVLWLLENPNLLAKTSHGKMHSDTPHRESVSHTQVRADMPAPCGILLRKLTSVLLSPQMNGPSNRACCQPCTGYGTRPTCC